MDNATARLFDRVTQLAFGIYGYTDDPAGNRQIRFGGSGVFVAPFQALTAAHVQRDLLRTDEYRADEFLRRTTGYFVPPHSCCLFQPVRSQGARRDDVANWIGRRTWFHPTSDLAFLEVFSEGPISAASPLLGRFKYFEWNLLPPKVGSRVEMIGFPGADVTAAGHLTNFRLELVLQQATVEEVHSVRRDAGMYSFPCFRVDQPVEGGFSGGPVFLDGRLCGIVAGDTFGETMVSTLWPLALLEFEYPDLGALNQKCYIGDLFDKEIIVASDWLKVKGRIRSEPDAFGKPQARLDVDES